MSVVQLPVQPTVQERHRMPRGRKKDRIDVRVDRETLEALDRLFEFYGKEVPKSEIVREAIIEKARRDLEQSHPKQGDQSS